MDASPPSSEETNGSGARTYIRRRDAASVVLRAMMSFGPADPNTHACSVDATTAHVQGGFKAGAVTALFITFTRLGW